MRRLRGWVAVAAFGLLLSEACSKDNTVDQTTTTVGVGEQCAEDADCGTSAVCTLGLCRLGCTTDAACPQGAICVGDRPPYGCTLPEESACVDDTSCAGDLTCGLDNKCRHPCAEASDCPRNEHTCRGQTCVSKGESNYTDWLCGFPEDAQPEGRARCTSGGGSSMGANSPIVYACNYSKVGWGEYDSCDPGFFCGNWADLSGPSEVDGGPTCIPENCCVGDCPDEIAACKADAECARCFNDGNLRESFECWELIKDIGACGTCGQGACM